MQPKTIQEGETAASADGRSHDAFEPEWIDGRFACLLSCSGCKGQIAVVGKYRVQDDRGYDPHNGPYGDYASYYTPLFFSDAPWIIDIPEEVPDKVKEQLLASFRLYWSDPEAAANRIRSALEYLLTAKGVRRTTGRLARNQRRVFLTLHARIQLFAKQHSVLAEHFMAVKWLGNAGSHSKPLTPDDVLDGYEIMAFALEELFANRSARVGALARAINRRKGPRSKRRGA